MKTCVEHLSVEIWILIFGYLEFHDLVHAFTNLNNYFDQLLASKYLLLNVKLKKDYQQNFIKFDLFTNHIVSLQPSTSFRSYYISQFLEKYSNQLIRLQSLTIKIRARKILSICKILQNLSSLQHLSITCVLNQRLIETILAMPRLHSCHLKIWRSILSLNFHSERKSHIQILSIKFLNETDFSIINLFLSHTPELKILDISQCDYSIHDLYTLFNPKSIIFEHVKTLKITWYYWKIVPDFLENLCKKMPALKYLHFNISQKLQTELLLRNLIQYWCSSLEQTRMISTFIHYKEYTKVQNEMKQINMGGPAKTF